MKTESCWIWQGRKHGGYGYCKLLDEQLAHRISWRIYRGDTKGLHVLHSCDNRACVNPNHLFLGTNEDNVKDKVIKGRQTKGIEINTARIDEDTVREIRRLKQAYWSAKEISDQLKLPYRLTCYVISGDTWKHVN